MLSNHSANVWIKKGWIFRKQKIMWEKSKIKYDQNQFSMLEEIDALINDNKIANSIAVDIKYEIWIKNTHQA